MTICSSPMIVRHAEAMLYLSNSILGSSVTESVLRRTFFAHFCAGEDATSIVPTLKKLRSHGVGGILDYAAEADLGEASAPVLENQPSRTYPYESEAQCEANLHIFLSAVRAVKDTTPDGFAAVKVTALGDPALLERVSNAVVELRAFFNRLDPSNSGRLTRDAFVAGWSDAFHADAEESGRVFDRIVQTSASDGTVDVLEFTNRLSLEEMAPLVQSCRSRGPLYHSALTEAECAALQLTMARLDEVASLARSLGVRLMIDAEHSYFQPAIEHATLRLQRKHNHGYPCIFSTQQAYLVDCSTRLALDIERARREGWHLGIKLVRGAYMLHERERAQRLGARSPIHPTVEDTHKSYDDAIDTLLLRSPCPDRTSLMVATHNQASVERTARLLLRNERGEHPSRVSSSQVYFGQLLGMADNLTFTLAAQGLKSYKYVPYGPVREVLPYLLRRAHENADALSTALTQRNMMLWEVLRRLTGRS